MNILIRGGGDLASGIALRLYKCHFKVLILEIEQPRVVRRSVSFANAVYEKDIKIEDVAGHLITTPQEIIPFDFSAGIPVFIDPAGVVQDLFKPSVVIDARMLKKQVSYDLGWEPLILGLGPGFHGGVNCHAAIETNRGHFLGRVLWDRPTQADTGVPGIVQGKQAERVLRAPAAGIIQSKAQLGQFFNQGDEIAYVNKMPIRAPFQGCLRGLMHNGLRVEAGEKVGDLDPRLDTRYTKYISEKSLAIAGGVLEAILSYFQPFP